MAMRACRRRLVPAASRRAAASCTVAPVTASSCFACAARMRPGIGRPLAGSPCSSRWTVIVATPVTCQQRTARNGAVALADRGGRETGSMRSSVKSSVFAGFRFPREVISVAVRWYLRYGLSYRDVEELMAERGVTVDHVTVYRWVQRFTPEFIEAARPCRHAPGDRWFVDETYLKVAGRWTYLY